MREGLHCSLCFRVKCSLWWVGGDFLWLLGAVSRHASSNSQDLRFLFVVSVCGKNFLLLLW